MLNDGFKSIINQYHVRMLVLSVPSAQLRTAKAAFDRFILQTADEVPVFRKGEAKPQLGNQARELVGLLFGTLSMPRNSNSRFTGAFSVYESIDCLYDSIRTKKFFLGIRDAVALLEARNDDKIRVCDAGCGALPIQAIYAALCSERVVCTALELNPVSAEFARKVIAQLGLQDRINVVHCNAIKYVAPANFDLIISETMDAGLTSEPLVQILANLSQYLVPGGLMLPSKVDILAALVQVEHFNNPDGYVYFYGHIHHRLKVDWQQVLTYDSGTHLDVIRANISTAGHSPGLHLLLLTSRVHILEHVLDLYQSPLTSQVFFYTDDRKVAMFDLTGIAEDIGFSYIPGACMGTLSKSAQDYYLSDA